MSSAPQPAPTPYDLIGGDPAVRTLVKRFYALMDEDPAFADLRRMHAPDLRLMEEKLGDWLTGWLGGPQIYLERPDAACIGSAHAAFPIDARIRDQWLECMYRALDEVDPPAETRSRIRAGFAQLAEFLRNR